METAQQTGTFDPAVPLTEIRESKHNPRTHFDPVKLAELTASIKEKGILTPLLVRPCNGSFEIGAGHRRYRSAKAAGLEAVPAIVRTMDDASFIELLNFENLEREDLHPLEEAQGYARLLKLPNYTIEKIADRRGCSKAFIYDRLKLTELIKPLQQCFLDGEILLAHAIILARLTPSEQKRVLGDPEMDGGGLFTDEHGLFDDDCDHRKAVSPRELQAWVDKYVRFDRAKIDPMLFPATAETITAAQVEKEKVIAITYAYHVHPDAKAPERTYGPQSWTRADGEMWHNPRTFKDEKSKTCDHSVTGIVVVGQDRGEAFKVCIAKDKCAIHYGAEQKAKKQLAKGGSSAAKERGRQERENQRREAERKREDAARERWKKAAPAILEAVVAAIKKAATRADGPLAHLIIAKVKPWNATGIGKHLALGKTADDLVRYAALLAVWGRLHDEWQAPLEIPTVAKELGINLNKILDEVAPVEKAEAPAGSAEKKRNVTKPRKKKAR